MSSGSFAKREREKAKKEKAEIKRERREIRRSDAGDDEGSTPTRPQEEVLAALAALHEAHTDGRIAFEDFEAAKAELVAQLSV
ncbi:MAG: hypothetical protein ACO3C1_08355 [Ilumatobacteraceae bacterium]